MADQKISDLTAAAAVADTDIFYGVKDPGGTPLDRKFTVAQLKAHIGSSSGADELAHESASIALTGVGSSFATVTGSDLGATLTANAVYITGWVRVTQQTSSAAPQLRIFDVTAGSAISSGVQNTGCPTLAAGVTMTLPFKYRHDPGAGARTYRIEISTGAGTVDCDAYHYTIMEVAE